MKNKLKPLIPIIVSVVITSILFFTPLWYYGPYLRSQGVYIPLKMQLRMLTGLGYLIAIPLAIVVYLLEHKKKNVDERNEVKK